MAQFKELRQFTWLTALMSPHKNVIVAFCGSGGKVVLWHRKFGGALKRAGKLIGGMDLMMAAPAMAKDSMLITNNARVVGQAYVLEAPSSIFGFFKLDN